MTVRLILTLLLLQVACLPSEALLLCRWCRPPPGDQGPRGSPGSPGQQGEQGWPGSRGEKGPMGPRGLDGKQGPVGSTGEPGPRGYSGSNGAQGPPGCEGARGPPGLKGERGASGSNGAQGQSGVKGERGSSGSQGAQGPSGVKGERGSSGSKGAQGPPGVKGERGPSGSNGSQGPTGVKGERGLPGSNGTQGPPGERGASGSNGAPGPLGPKGCDGVKGDQGPPGPDYNATWFALLGACQKQKPPSLIDGGFGYDVVREECEKFTAKALEQLQSFIENPINPDKGKKFTVKTCRDLFITHLDASTGEYWIDPNDGDDSDRIFVHCDAEKRSTCITPTINQSKVISYDGEEKEVWLSEIEGGMQIKYPESSQISALQILSSHAEQKVTYRCMKSVGYFDAVGRTYERGLKLSAWTEVELAPRGLRRLRYDVISDECQDRLDEWRKTVITYRTDKPVLLPVVDVALRDVMGPGKSFAVEIGQVCFS